MTDPIERLAAIIRRVVETNARMKAKNGFDPLPGSQADKEIAAGFTVGEHRPVLEAFQMAEWRLLASLDHLATAGRVVHDPESVYAVAGMARLQRLTVASLTTERGRGHPVAVNLVGENFTDASDVVELPLLREEVVDVGGFVVGREVTEPGWRWSEHARPVLGGDWCQDRHVGITVEGRWGVELPDGSTIEFGPGDVFEVPAGHDSWTIGDEPCVTISWTPASTP
jgi:hypothetical protein